MNKISTFSARIYLCYKLAEMCLNFECSSAKI